MRQRAIAAAALASLAIAVAACGSSNKSTTAGSGGSSSTSSSAPTRSGYGGYGGGGGTTSKGVSVALSKVSFGSVLVGPNSHTLYMFLKDKGTTSTCNGQCAQVWAPLTTSGQPQAGSGLNASLLATSKRSDGTDQVTYGGHPLYYYDDDKQPGMTKGQAKKEFGAEWYAVGADGKKVEKSGS